VAILRGRDANETTGARAGGGARTGGRRWRDSGRVGAHASRGGWVGRPARRLVRPLGPGDGRMDPSP
jgi:hypothetical protein